MKAGDKWLHTTDIADAMGVTAETVRRFIRDGHLRATAVRLGERTIYRVRLSDYERFRKAYVRDTTRDDWEW